MTSMDRSEPEDLADSGIPEMELDTTAEVIWPAGLASLIRDVLSRR